MTFRDHFSHAVTVDCSNKSDLMEKSIFFRTKLVDSTVHDISIIEESAYDAASFFLEILNGFDNFHTRLSQLTWNKHWALLSFKWEIMEYKSAYISIASFYSHKLFQASDAQISGVRVIGGICNHHDINGSYDICAESHCDMPIYKHHDDQNLLIVYIQEGTSSEYWIQERKMKGHRMGLAYIPCKPGCRPYECAIDVKWTVKVGHSYEDQECMKVEALISETDVAIFWEIFDVLMSQSITFPTAFSNLMTIDDVIDLLVRCRLLSIPSDVRRHFSAAETWRFVDSLRSLKMLNSESEVRYTMPHVHAPVAEKGL